MSHTQDLAKALSYRWPWCQGHSSQRRRRTADSTAPSNDLIANDCLRSHALVVRSTVVVQKSYPGCAEAGYLNVEMGVALKVLYVGSVTTHDRGWLFAAVADARDNCDQQGWILSEAVEDHTYYIVGTWNDFQMQHADRMDWDGHCYSGFW